MQPIKEADDSSSKATSNGHFKVAGGTPPREDKYEDKYKAMIVTPEGSIISFGDPRERKPETDPDWEEREAKRMAKRVRRL